MNTLKYAVIFFFFVNLPLLAQTKKNDKATKDSTETKKEKKYDDLVKKSLVKKRALYNISKRYGLLF